MTMAEQLVNVHDLVGRCPFATSQKLLAGKWSLLIIFCPIRLKVFVVSVCSKAIIGLP